jgi:hypothetical protein
MVINDFTAILSTEQQAMGAKLVYEPGRATGILKYPKIP